MFTAKKPILLTLLLTMVTPILASCSTNDPSYTYLKVLNSEDYIYKQKNSQDLPDLTVQFEQEMLKKGKKVKVIYDTFDTNENMLNTLKTGKTKYDLVCASDYMIQKLVSLDLLERMNFDQIENYKNYCSPFLRKKLNDIKLKDSATLDDYSVAYMWGTLGLVYNPMYQTFIDRGINKGEVISSLESYSSLWDPKFNKTISIKDSMRDTYAIGILHSFKDEFDKPTPFKTRNAVFNYGGEEDNEAKEHIKIVQEDLIKLRENIFGFEIDGGKEDIVTKKIGIDLAWSGDAVYSIKKARNPEETTNPFPLYYSLPKEGSNMWIDIWAMEKGANKELSNEFLNFISSPNKAILNMQYIGFTSSIANSDVLDYMKNLYHPTSSSNTVLYDLSYFFGDGVSIEVDDDLLQQMKAQFPPSDYTDENNGRLFMMKDFGANNDLILNMWQEVKFERLPTWAIVLLVVEIIIIGGLIAAIVIVKSKTKKQRKNRRAKC